LISAIVLQEHPGSTIVTDSILGKRPNSSGQRFKGFTASHQTRLQNVIDESIRLNKTGQESWLAIETWTWSFERKVLSG